MLALEIGHEICNGEINFMSIALTTGMAESKIARDDLFVEFPRSSMPSPRVCRMSISVIPIECSFANGHSDFRGCPRSLHAHGIDQNRNARCASAQNI